MSMQDPDVAEVTDKTADLPEDEGSVRASLEAAFDKAGPEETEETVEPVKTGKADKADAKADDKAAEPADKKAAPEAVDDKAAEPAKDAPKAEYAKGEAISAAIVAGEWDKVDTTRPPSSLSVEAKAKFAALDEPLRREFLRLDANFHKGIEQYKTDAGTGREFAQAVQPYLAMIQAEGGTPVAAFKDLLNTAYQLRQNPAAVIQALVEKYKVELPKPGEQKHVDPEVAELRQQLDDLKNGLTEGQQAQQAELRRAADDTLAKFASDPKNVYFADVRNSMATLIQSGEAKDVQEAYDKACWMKPEIRQTLTQQAAAKAEQERITEAKRKAADAKRAAFDVSGSGAATNGKSELSLRQTLEAAFPE